MDEDDKPGHPLHADLELYGWMEHQRLFHRNGVNSFKYRNSPPVMILWARECLEAEILLSKYFCQKSQ